MVTLAQTFNRLYAASRNVTISKSYVHYTVSLHRLKIEQERRRIRQRKPVALQKNTVWGIDMTGKADDGGQMHTILGILGHSSRNALSPAVLANKSSWTLLGHLCLAIGRHGTPKAIRTDNESVFTSRVFSAGLACFGIRHQRTDVGCPWQNGRIERFFGTLKQVLDQWTVENKQQLQDSLDLFRCWYCTVRPHANLNGATPHEAWNGIDPHQSTPTQVEWFEAWDGLLTGYLIKRE